MNRTIFKFFALILLLGVFLGVIGPAPTAVKALTSSFDFPPGPTAIPDPGAGLSCQNSITRTVNVPTSFIIADLNVGLNISHARRSDVRVTLTPPTGPVVVLISGAGLGSPTIASPDDFDNYDVMLDDASLNSLFDNDDDNTGGALYERNAKPYGLLSSFKGLDAQGIWTLSICDTRNGTAGNYLNGRLVFTSADPDTITGTVFTDFNDNGLRNPGDLPVSGVTVTAFDASGAVVDSDVTNAAGGYTLNILNGTQVRIEFTAIPANLRPGAFGRDSGTTVQFVTSPGAGVDLGLTNPFEYCQNNPFLVMPCYINGDPLAGGAAGTWDTLVSIPNDAFGRTDANIEKTLATGAQIGTTWGLAYQRTTNNVFAGALTKRHSGMGPLGAGGIYRVVINPATGASVSVSNFVDISQPPLSIPIIASGTYPPNSGPGGRGLVANSNTPNTDPLAWDLVGKSSIGDMDIGTNDDVIWLVNLANQTLYSLPVGIPAVAPTTYNAYPITLPAGATACPTADVRPWAVEIYRNEVYVGVVCSAESSQNVNALRAYILKISEAAPPPGSFQLVFEFPLNYPRGIVSEDTPGYPAEWRPWSPVMTSLCRGSVPDPCNAITDLAYDKQIIYPQPILSDIEFDTNGDLILGFMDRLGHQAGNANYATSNPWANPPGGTVILYDMNNGYAQSNATFVANAVFEGVSAGDVLRACRTGGGGFILENNATCGSLTTGGIASAPAQGPGGGEYYWQDMYPASTDKDSGTHNEVLLGGLVLFPGTGEVAVSMFDPFDIRSGGVTWLNNTTGNRNRAYEVFPADSGGGATTFGKAAGIGDLEGFCYSAPIEIGNRVWVDTNGNGIQEPGEAPLANVTVELLDSNGVVISTVTTDASGNYFFSSGPGTDSGNQDYLISGLLPNSNYTVRIPDISGGSQQAALVGMSLTQANQGQDLHDSDATVNGVNAVISVTTGNPGGNNHTYDFGFQPAYSLGNRVWLDDGTGGGVADNGVQDGTEVGIGNVVVNLYADTNNDGTPDGGIIGTQTTDANGYYRFDNLLPGYYIVEIAASNFTGPLTGLASSSVDEASPNSDVDRNDNGLGIIPDAVNGIRSGTVQLGPGTTEPQNETDLSPTGQGAADDRANMTVDFGFVPSYSLGNRVWFDTNNNNLIDFGTEVGIDGVWVELYQDNGDNVFGPGDTFVTGQSTTSGGYYRFDNLPAGDYIVVIPDDNFRDVPGDTVPGNPLAGYWSSGTGIDAAGVVSDSTANDADTTATDSDENGRSTITGNRVDYVASAAVTLGPGTTEPLNETDLSATGQGAADGRANMTVDFGFYRQEVGDVVFVDLNNSGIFDGVPTDALLSGAQVQLYSSNGTEINVGPDGILGTSDDASGGVVTGPSGTYQFSGLPEGDYIIRVTPPVGYSSTVDSAAPSDTANPDINSNSNDNGIGIGTGQVSSGTLTMTPGQGTGGSAGKPNNVVTQGVGRTVDNTVDFGFVITGVFTKTIVGTNETFTTDPNVAVGEIVTYEIVYNLPLGTALNNVTITDRMDKGLAYVDCLQVLVAGADQTAAVCPTAIVSSITNPGDSAANPANPGRQVVFNLGNIPAQAAAATIRVRYRAIVLDVIENVQGVSLNNDVTIDHSGGSFSTSAPDVIIVEPDLVIEKTAVPSVNVAVGTPITFTLTINHSPLSQTDAFDVEVTDILPPELEYIPCTIAYSGFAPTSPTLPTAFCPGATNTLAFRWDVLPLGATSTITFNARLVAPTAENAANVAWTSLPIDLAPNGQPVQLSVHNSRSTERWFDPLDNVNIYGRSRRFRINPVASGDPPEDSIDLPERLPETGFAPGVQTIVPAQPVDLAYRATDIWLEIPRLGLKIPIVGVPLAQDDWDLTWLWNEAGWLEGTAFPSWSGNSVLTGHVTLPNGQEGPFAEIGKLKWGDRVIIHAYGATFEYEVRQNRTVSPLNSDVLEHEEEPWLTLITCKTFNESSGEYTSRIAIRAVLVGVEAGKTSNSGRNIR